MTNSRAATMQKNNET